MMISKLVTIILSFNITIDNGRIIVCNFFKVIISVFRAHRSIEDGILLQWLTAVNC